MKTKFKVILTWFLQILMGLEFLIAGQAKFTQPGVWSKQFANWGYPDNFYLVIGALEVIGGILIFFPKFAAKAAIGMGVIMIGATITHAVHGQWKSIIVTMIITGILAGVYALRKER